MTAIAPDAYIFTPNSITFGEILPFAELAFCRLGCAPGPQMIDPPVMLMLIKPGQEESARIAISSKIVDSEFANRTLEIFNKKLTTDHEHYRRTLCQEIDVVADYSTNCFWIPATPDTAKTLCVLNKCGQVSFSRHPSQMLFHVAAETVWGCQAMHALQILDLHQLLQ